ncbi:MAG: hypothetical protein V3T44_02255 [bacterium]
MRFAKGPPGLSLIFLLGALLTFFGEVRSQDKALEIAPPLGKSLGGIFRGSSPALRKKLEKRRLQLLEMGWLEFWEREDALWRRIEKLAKEGEKIDKRLYSLEKKKGEILARLRKLYREKRPLSERMNDLLALRNLARSILPLAAERARASSGAMVLLQEWVLFQDLAQELVKRESGRSQKRIAASIVDGFLHAFRKGDAERVSRLLFRGIRVNGKFDQRAYLRHLKTYFLRVHVVSFDVRNRSFREVNPFTLRVGGSFHLKEVEKVQDKKKKPRSRDRRGKISFTLREIGGRWLISKMGVPD